MRVIFDQRTNDGEIHPVGNERWIDLMHSFWLAPSGDEFTYVQLRTILHRLPLALQGHGDLDAPVYTAIAQRSGLWA